MSTITPTVIYPASFLEFIARIEKMMDCTPGELNNLIYVFEEGKDNTVMSDDGKGSNEVLIYMNEVTQAMVMEKWIPVFSLTPVETLMTYTWDVLLSLLHFGSPDGESPINVEIQGVLAGGDKEVVFAYINEKVLEHERVALENTRQTNGFAIMSHSHPTPTSYVEAVCTHSLLETPEGKRVEVAFLGYNAMGEDIVLNLIDKVTSNTLQVVPGNVFEVPEWTNEDNQPLMVKIITPPAVFKESYTFRSLDEGVEVLLLVEANANGVFLHENIHDNVAELTMNPDDPIELVKLPSAVDVWAEVPTERETLGMWLSAATRLGYLIEWAKTDEDGNLLPVDKAAGVAIH